MLAQYVIGLLDENLLNLCMQMSLRLLDQDKMQRGDEGILRT